MARASNPGGMCDRDMRGQAGGVTTTDESACLRTVGEGGRDVGHEPDLLVHPLLG